MQNSVNKLRAREYVNIYAVVGCFIVLIAIIPGMTSAMLCIMEIIMCCQIGRIYRGDRFTIQEAMAMCRIVGFVAIVAPMIALEIINLVPILGWLIKAAVAAGIMKGLGEAIIARYEKAERELAVEPPQIRPPAIEASHVAMLAAPAAGVTCASATGVSVEERLAKLTELLGKALISQAEHDAKRREILAGM